MQCVYLLKMRAIDIHLITRLPFRPNIFLYQTLESRLYESKFFMNLQKNHSNCSIHVEIPTMIIVRLFCQTSAEASASFIDVSHPLLLH